ncbi:MAG: TrkH family potassium uptake protein [Prevotella sp.]|nr:TrkH family potassium uptake protein [Prevotella sp.]
MVNLRIVCKIIGQLLLLLAFMMLVCMGMACCYEEDDILPFLYSTLITAVCGLLLRQWGSNAENNLYRRDAYLVVTLTWVIYSLFGMLPFIIGGYITNVADAYFEMMSGFTTTGATILDDVECLPHGILFWRSLSQWIGGLGIVFFTVALLPAMVGGSTKVFSAEITGPMYTRMHPRISTNAKWIWSIYTTLTAICLFCYWAAGMDWYDSLNYSMTTLATGGFAPHNESTAFFRRPLIEYLTIIFMFLSGTNFTLLYIGVFKMKLRRMLENTEFKLYISLVALFTVTIMLILIIRMDYGIEQALRSGLFQTVSFMTTTGLFNDDAAQWPHITWVLLGICMFVGACAGSTSGGFKLIRSSMILKIIQNEFRHNLHPNAVLPIKVNGQTVPQNTLPTLIAFFGIYVIMIIIAASLMIIIGIDNTNAITIALSCMSNVGPTLGTQIGPEMSWSSLPDAIKWTCSIMMLMGRLEIMTVLVLFTKSYWREN